MSKEEREEYEQLMQENAHLEEQVDIKQAVIRQLITDIHTLSQEVEAMYLQQKWNTTDRGQTHPSPGQEAARICQQLQHNPQLFEGFYIFHVSLRHRYLYVQ
uniref:Uncharacterized protein n=1 Tax=Branchiostoma floridae TaxID=7739 RepID=C3ZKP3_BRAFL|eukprot:XP_002590881.1 hypothetical protein BRAFLDRAFT_101147 [Branchiostoma floridae]